MKFYLGGISILIALASVAAEQPEKSAQRAAESWLDLVDAGKAAETWDALAAPARQAIGQWRWKIGFSLTQRTFGSFTERKFRVARFSNKSPSGRSGEFVFLEFGATSSKKGAVVEKIATTHESDGVWRVVTYTVDSN